MSSLPAEIKVLLILAKTLEKKKLNFSCIALFHVKTRYTLEYFVDRVKAKSRNLYSIIKRWKKGTRDGRKIIFAGNL